MSFTLQKLYRAFVGWTMPERWIVARFIAHAAATRIGLPAGPIVDVAAGNAPYAAALARAFPGRALWRFDLHAAAHPHAAANAQTLPLRDGSAAIVCIFHSIQHFADPERALAEARRVLAPGGLLLITYPISLPDTRLHDLWRWTTAGMAHDLAAAGFENIESHPHGGLAYRITYTAALLPLVYLVRNRNGWRSGRSSGDLARLALANLLTAPFNLLGFPALLIDAIIPTRAFAIYAGATARRK